MKKLVAIVLAVAMMMTAAVASVSAEEVATGAAPIVFGASSVTANKGDTITVDISVSENHYMVNGQIWIEYNPQCLELLEVWEDEDCPYFEDINTSIFKSSYMWMFGAPTPGVAEIAFASSSSKGTTAGGVMFTLTFKVLDTAYTSDIDVVVGDDDMSCNDGVTAGGEDFKATWTAGKGTITVEGTEPPAPPVEDVENDVNIDGKLDAADAKALFFYVNRAEELTEAQLAKADINADGAINLYDAVRLFYIVNEII